MELPATKQEKIKLTEINQYLTCFLCKGYLIDATTISECLHSFCRSCIIKFLQDNSYCPVCELIINKAKPNLKLDKTLQDIVYKLVPELFLKEMLRRKTYYKDYPQIAARVSPEERGEDTERTIFNPQETISLSLEYIRDDSTPGAIRIPGIASDPDALKGNGTLEENQDSLMKRYLLCPGMCRIEVLKKFVRNKYNVDTNHFFIDVLYKRVPLPDHYTLIDIAYIYSWQRNELMKFFFRIIDRNKAKRTDSPVNCIPQFIPRHFRKSRNHGERVKREPLSEKKSRRKSFGRKQPSQTEIKQEPTRISDIKTETDIEEEVCKVDARTITCSDDNNLESSEIDRVRVKSNEPSLNDTVPVIKTEKSKSDYEQHDIEALGNDTELTEKVNKELYKPAEVPQEKSTKVADYSNTIPKSETVGENTASLLPVLKTEPISPETEKTENKLILKVSKEFLDTVNFTSSKPIYSKPVTKSYTSITLNRSENVEIITKIEPVSNKDGKAIGHHIIKQTIKKGSKIKSNSPKKLSSKSGQIPRLMISKKGVKKKTSPKREIDGRNKKKEITKSDQSVIENYKLEPKIEDEKSNFFNYMNLAPTTSIVAKNESEDKVKQEVVESPPPQNPLTSKKQIIISQPTGGQKRKNSSPLKNDKSKIPKIENKKAVKIILQEKPPSQVTTATNKSDTGLQSLISNCKIPSSLSITIKEGSEDSSPLVAPPVKNYIEILKLPEEVSSEKSPENKSKETTKLDLSKFCDNDSEQKVDQDLAEIAKSLTEKIPMSTTISQIVGPKQQFQIPVKTNIPPKAQLQPTPVPELNKALNVPTKDGLVKLNPRSRQTFQKIFEESLKKPPDGPKTSAVELPTGAENETGTPTTSKRNILDIASQLFKKSKVEQEKKDVTLPKVPIPRLPNSRTQKVLGCQAVPKLISQTVANLHSSSLGMNYTVSVDQQSPVKVMKSNGIVSPVKAESVPGVPECKPSVSPLNEIKSAKTDFKVPSPSIGSPKLPEVSSASCPSPRPKTPSPKSSPLVKHMYAPSTSMFTQKVPLRINRFASLAPKPATKSPKPSTSSPKSSPKPVSPTPSCSSTQNGNLSTLSPNEILEKYNIPNLAQLTANFNLSPSVLASNQLAAFQHAMLLKHFEMQNRQNWLNRNQGPLLQYEKYLQNLNGGSHNQT